jgi:outer membrane receptor protein involved in Fe transport
MIHIPPKTTLLSFCLGLALTQVTHANQNEANLSYLINLSLDELLQVQIITVATGSEQTSAQAPAVISVITAEEIKNIGADNLGDVLQTIPGFHVRRSGVFYQDTYSIRGVSSTFNPEVLMMIDGIPVNSLTIGGSRRPFWDAPLLHDISRIEIVRGPGSAMYGADAYSGVINIITKTAKGIEGTEIGIRGGAFNSGEGWLLHGGKANGFDYSMSLQYLTTDGPEVISGRDRQTLYDEWLGTNASVATQPFNLNRDAFDGRLHIGKGNWRFSTSYMGRYDVGRGNSSDPTGTIDDKRFEASLTWHNPKLTEHWDVQAQVSFQNMREWPNNYLLSAPPGSARPGPNGSLIYYPEGIIFSIGFAERHARSEFSAFYTGLENHKIRIGAGSHHVNAHDMISVTNIGLNPFTGTMLSPLEPPIDVAGTPRGITPTGKRDDYHVYIQDMWAFAPKWELTAGLRYDHYSDFGSTINPRLALVNSFSEALTTKFLYGRAFRAPSINEMAAAGNIDIGGSLNVRPEKIDTWEIAAEWQARDTLRLSGNLFYYQATDKIEFAPLAGRTDVITVAQNIGKQNGQGFELEMRWQATKKFSLLANYAYVETQNEITGSPFGNDPEQQAYLRADWNFAKDWNVFPQLTWVGERERRTSDPRPTLDGYTQVDLTLRYGKIKQSGDWNISAGIRNVLDKEMHDPLGYDMINLGGQNVATGKDQPLSGRSWFVALNYKF